MRIKLEKKLTEHFDKAPLEPFVLNNINEEQWLFIYDELLKGHIFPDKKHQVFVFETDEQAEKFYGISKEQAPTLYFPDLGQNIFSGVFANERDLNERLLVLNKIFNDDKNYRIVCSYQSLFLKVPPPIFFESHVLEVNVSDIISPSDLAQKLVEMGYTHAPTVEEPGTFTQKGEIFDVFPLAGRPIRLHYFDDMVEEIFGINQENLRTEREAPFESVSIFPMSGSALTNEGVTHFRKNLPRPALNFKEQNLLREDMLKKLDSRNFFPNYPLYFSLFFESWSSLSVLLAANSAFHFFNLEDSIKAFELSLEELETLYDENKDDPKSDEVLPSPKLLYDYDNRTIEAPSIVLNGVGIVSGLDGELSNSIFLGIEDVKTYISHKNIVASKSDRGAYIKALIKTVFEDPKSEKIWVVYKNQSTLNQIQNIIRPFLRPETKAVHYKSFDLSSGFVYPSEKMFVLSESDFFIHKVNKAKKVSSSKKDVFADQLASLRANDYVIHKEHGVGKYLGIETISLGAQTADYIALEYHDGDKVYVPMYKLDLIQKHSSSEATVKVANLKTKKFDLERAKASKSVKKLAFDLLELQAKRELKKGHKFSPPDEIYQEFESKFPFQETEDQIKAINDVIDDMTSERPMDRLICGDVGFGKTEIAMRAAFKAVLDHKQVAVLVPTTVLAFQHYNTMVQRFKDFPVNIEYVSRFKSAKQTNEILERLEQGKVDIIVGTHKLLGERVKFHDLGLMVIDEEQRFGVGHKEKMKTLKENIDCLTMTATPIPRTLQMSFLGIKDLSLIQTPPPKRQSIKTYLIKDDPNTIKKAIDKEIGRGGQIFVVHNKVKDIEEYTAKIKKLSPQAKTLFAHGQLPERELEKRITQFYEQKYDLLVSTTIIESGIDIPSANTMIVDRADTYGLSQLHQLRGRIGRSDKKAYAYFVVPHNRVLSSVAAKRLRALQTYAEMGAGFSLATSDLEIRGSGDILGAEQSGHIANIGLELYMELLKEAIAEIKNEPIATKRSVEIQTPFNASISESYISDTGVRLKYYKKLSNAPDIESLQAISDELMDLYGMHPEGLENLLIILQARLLLSKALVSTVKVGSKQIVLGFDKQELEQNDKLRGKIIDLFIQRPKVYKINPDMTVNCKFAEKVTPKTLLDFSNFIAQQIEPC